MNTNEYDVQSRQAAINGLAIVGFIALVIAGIWLAVYSTRFVPIVVNDISAAAVYLGSVFDSDETTLSVVETPATTTIINFGTPDSDAVPVVTPKPTAQTEVPQTTPYGLPDLTVRIITVGYQTTPSVDSFIQSPTVPVGAFPAVKFAVANIGTNWSGAWRLSAVIPTMADATFKADRFETIESLAPVGNLASTRVFIISFTNANQGSDQPVIITANYDGFIKESNTDNNSASANVTVQ